MIFIDTGAVEMLTMLTIFPQELIYEAKRSD